MGQSTSTARQTRSAMNASKEQQESSSGVSLAPELEEAIVRDFSNQNLQDEWNKFRTDVLLKRNERLQRRSASLQQIQAQFHQNNSSRQPKLDALNEKLDNLHAQFADISVAMDYDIKRVSEIYGQTTKSTPLPYCLGERAHWIDCSKKYAADMRPCDAYMAALERCVNRTILHEEQVAQ